MGFPGSPSASIQAFQEFFAQSRSIGLICLDGKGTVVAHNSFLESILERADLKGQAFSSLISPENASLLVGGLPPAKMGYLLSLSGVMGSPQAMMCSCFHLDDGALVLLENSRITDDIVLQRMSTLNNEIACISTDLSRRNRRNQDRIKLASLTRSSDKWYSWSIDLRSDLLEFQGPWQQQEGFLEVDPPTDLEGWIDQIHEQDRDLFSRPLKQILNGQLTSFQAEYRLATSSGGFQWFRVAARLYTAGPNGAARRIVGSHLDIGERKTAKATQVELLAKLRQKYRMETIGSLTSGLIHNLNNNLAIILGSIDHSRSILEGNSEVGQLLESARTAVFRSRQTIQQVLGLGKADTEVKLSQDLGALTGETLELMQAIIPRTIHLAFHGGEDDAPRVVLGSSTRIQEALINLITNARQAISNNGHLDVSLTTVVIKGEDIPSSFAVHPGTFHCLAVKDDGTGIPDENLDRIFEPFFTTKSIGKGSGMGLATVREIVEQHQGFLRVQSQLGKGSKFELFFPAAREKPAAKAPAKPENAGSGKEKILLLDDEEMLAELGKRILSAAGYQVTVLTSSREALNFFSGNPHVFDLVITDLNMKELSGVELIAEMRQARPDMPMILMSGDINQMNEAETLALGINAFCSKPVGSGELRRIVRRVLDEVKPN